VLRKEADGRAARPSPPEPAPSAAVDAASKTDEQILAEVAGATPSTAASCALMAIGQARATRIAKAAANAPASHEPPSR
jgi:hypothetical protein